MKKLYFAAGESARAIRSRIGRLLVIPMLLSGCFASVAVAQTSSADVRVTLDVRNATVAEVFQAIQNQTGYSFVYNTADIDTARPVSLSARDERLQQVLDELLKPADVTYTLRDRHIVLSKRSRQNPPPELILRALAER